VRRYENPDGTLTEAGKKRYFNKNGNMKIRGLLPNNRREFERMMTRSANPFPDTRKRVAQLYRDLSSWAKKNKVNEDDYVSDYLRDQYLKTGKDYWGDPSGHPLSYRKKVVDYSNKYDEINKIDMRLRNEEHARMDNAIKLLNLDRYTLKDYERDFEGKH
jgi:hypothetical protein